MKDKTDEQKCRPCLDTAGELRHRLAGGRHYQVRLEAGCWSIHIYQLSDPADWQIFDYYFSDPGAACEDGIWQKRELRQMPFIFRQRLSRELITGLEADTIPLIHHDGQIN